MRDFQRSGRSVAYGTNGMAATSSPLATLAAVETLRSGGNAVDAAVTASAILCVTEPHMTGIGGDCFALIGRKDGSIIGLNGSGRAPAAADREWLKTAGLEAGISETSVHSVTVPGAIDAWHHLLAHHGTISLAQALEPAIGFAERGVPATPRVAWDWQRQVSKLEADEGSRRHLLFNGKAPLSGEVYRLPALAETMRIIAKEGREAFYEGAIAEDLVSFLQSRGGLHELEDFRATCHDYVEPISTNYAGSDIVELPPNGQGLTVLIALNILKRFDLAGFAHDGVERTHLQLEAIRIAFELRNEHIADPGFHEVPVSELLSDSTADRMADRISLTRSLPVSGKEKMPLAADTVYLTVVDKEGTAISFINSVFAAFGSGMTSPKTGITLHNRGKGFMTDPNHPNCIGPSRRPLHTIIPAMIRKDGRIAGSYGVMGGAYQPMGHVQVAVNMLTYGMDIQEAIDAPRYFFENGVVSLEKGASDMVARGLSDLGHEVVRPNEPLGGGQGIMLGTNGVLTGGSDPRKDGLALGI
ncbi:gamma-glutamyltranspeptidase/glutathione hydrolase [Rhodoligotrophos appendicifer]|uniref:gamma-glutamyltransferase n=1 Tax=Rhodoligotrophos appendicifer TaxID=987056 RepID=UPI0011863F79|nr:gamma-glutamyltransferase [Rhodoligotrophos appendicifer]